MSTTHIAITQLLVLLLAGAVFLMRRGNASSTTAPPEITSTQDLIDYLAGEAVKTAKEDYGVELNFTADSIENVEGVLGKMHEHYINSASQEGVTGLSSAFGAYIGECIRREYLDSYWAVDHPVGRWKWACTRCHGAHLVAGTLLGDLRAAGAGPGNERARLQCCGRTRRRAPSRPARPPGGQRR